MVGIDVSKWQRDIDWEAVKPNIDFAIIRSNYGKYYDTRVERNVKECERLEIPYGLYVFSTAETINQAIDEALSVLTLAKDHKVGWPIYFDFEDEAMSRLMHVHGRPYIKVFNEMIITFCDYIEDAGYFAGVYFNQNFRKNYVNPFVRERYANWYAYYRPKCDYSAENLIWQYSNQGKIAGIDGDVDMNFTRYDLGNIIKVNKLNYWRDK